MKKKPGKKLTRMPEKPKSSEAKNEKASKDKDFSKGFEDGLAKNPPMPTSNDYTHGYKQGRAARIMRILGGHGTLSPQYPEYLEEEFK